MRTRSPFFAHHSRFAHARSTGAMSFIGMLVAAMLVAASASHAAVTFLSPLRTVQTFAVVTYTGQDDLFSSDIFSTQEIDQWQRDANCHVGVPGDEATSAASQLSYLLPSLILAEGSFFGHAEIAPGTDFAEGFGLSRVITQFVVDSETTVHVQAGLFANGNGSTNYTFRIANGAIFVNRTIQDGQDAIDETYTLPVGTYEVLASCSGYGQAFPGGGEPASGSFSTSLIFTQATAIGEVAASAIAPLAPIVAPNPVVGSTRIFPARGASGAIADAIDIVDVNGRIVRTLERVAPSGALWDTRDTTGQPVSAGVYWIRGGNGASTRAVVLR